MLVQMKTMKMMMINKFKNNNHKIKMMIEIMIQMGFKQLSQRVGTFRNDFLIKFLS